MDQIFAEMISTAAIAIALFGVVFSLVQAEYPRVSRSFAVFLLAVAVSNVPDAFDRIFTLVLGVRGQAISSVIWLSSSLFLAPLFWIYVFKLTSTTQRPPARLYRHLLLPGLAVIVALIILVSPQEIRMALVVDDALPTSGWPLALVVVFVLLEIAFYPQLAIYLFLIVRRMTHYRLTLRDFYASTEKHELRWIYAIGGFGGLYWIGQMLILSTAFDTETSSIPPAFMIIAGFSSLAIVTAMTLWGLRQRPPLVLETINENRSENADDLPSQHKTEKYEKSALTAEASTRIARKLRAAMEKDHMHRDANLSLWALARHIGASPNYISQTLSEDIGESFFDFVNGYRISDAMTLLSTSDDTVLAITYDVGFNARSSFYNAFKRVTGETPTEYRKKMSRPAGMDDIKA